MMKIRTTVIALVATGVLAVSSQPAQAATVQAATVFNMGGCSPCWIKASRIYPVISWNVTINPKQYATGVKAFISGWNLRSEWGHIYPAGKQVNVYTPNPLKLWPVA